MYKKKEKKKRIFFFSRNHTNFKRGKGFFTPGNNSHNLLLARTLHPVSVALGTTLLQQWGLEPPGGDSWEEDSST